MALTPQETLVEYTKGIQAQLAGSGVAPELIVTDADVLELMALPTSVAVTAVETLRKSIEQRHGFGFNQHLWPWCILHDKCFACSYGVRHKICGYLPRSDFGKVLRKLEDNNTEIDVVLSRKFYKQLWGRVNKVKVV